MPGAHPIDSSSPQVHVLEPGMLTSVQDLGRAGYARLGVPISGAADALSLRLANRLVGNEDGAAGLEMTLLGPLLRFHAHTRIALTGAPCDITLHRTSHAPGTTMPEPMVPWSCVSVQSGDVLRIGAARAGARMYLALAGGLDSPSVLGSRSTHTRAGLGGFQGRALRAGDVLRTHPADAAHSAGLLSAQAHALRTSIVSGDPLRACEVDVHHVPRDIRERFWNTTFTVSSRSDRMGVRLQPQGLHANVFAMPPIPSSEVTDANQANADPVGAHRVAPPGAQPQAPVGQLISEGMTVGAVQLPPGGEPIILGPDHPTTGGYPLLACVISADLHRIGQLRPGVPCRFERVTLAHARALAHDPVARASSP